MTNTSGEFTPEKELKQEAPPSSSSEEMLGFTPASEIYSVGKLHTSWLWSFAVWRLCLPFPQMKRKRVGAGQRGSSNPLQAAKEFLKPPTGSGEVNSGAPVACSIRARATALSASNTSPTKAGRGLSRKQQKLAEAAKTSRNISHYFSKKQATEKPEEGGLDPAPLYTSDGDEAGNQPSSPAAEAPQISPMWSESAGLGEADIINISDSEAEEETTGEPEFSTG